MSPRQDAPGVRDRRVLVYSMGMEGRDLATWLLRNGAQVTISDTRPPAQLAAAGATAPEGVERVVSGEGLLDPAGFDLVAVSQSILRHNPALARARALGIPITSQMRLFLQLCPGRVIGITGSSGKSTTTALVAAMAREAGVEAVVGGNIGEALLGRLGEIGAGTTVILEISHTQLQYTERSPQIAAVTNLTPNHLDQFSWDEYVGLKRNILAHQRAEDVAVLNRDDHTSRAFVPSVAGAAWFASIKGPVKEPGAWLEHGTIMLRARAIEERVVEREEIRLRGEHNLANVVMACAIAGAAGFAVEAMARAVRSFGGVRHRLEIAGHAAGLLWVNDSIATTPERAMAGIRSFTERVVLLVGGRHKDLPLDGLQELAKKRCRAVVCFGEAAELFAEALRRTVRTVEVVATLDEAVAAAARLGKAGDVVLLSPAGTSFDAYPSFEHRGEAFRALVRALPGFTEAAA